MRRRVFPVIGFIVAVLMMLSGMVQRLYAMEKDMAVPMIYPDDLITMLDRTDVVVLDVRSSASWEQAATKIRGAIREDPGAQIETWISKYSNYRTYVLY